MLVRDFSYSLQTAFLLKKDVFLFFGYFAWILLTLLVHFYDLTAISRTYILDEKRKANGGEAINLQNFRCCNNAFL